MKKMKKYSFVILTIAFLLVVTGLFLETKFSSENNIESMDANLTDEPYFSLVCSSTRHTDIMNLKTIEMTSFEFEYGILVAYEGLHETEPISEYLDISALEELWDHITYAQERYGAEGTVIGRTGQISREKNKITTISRYDLLILDPELALVPFEYGMNLEEVLSTQEMLSNNSASHQVGSVYSGIICE